MFRSRAVRSHAIGVALLFPGFGWVPDVQGADAKADTSVVATLRAEAAALRPQVRSALARAFLDGVPLLPEPKPAVVYRDSQATHYCSK